MFMDSALIELTEEEMFTLRAPNGHLLYSPHSLTFFQWHRRPEFSLRCFLFLRGESTGPSLTLSALISPSRLAAVFMIQTEEK